MPWNEYRLNNNKQILRKHPPKEFFLNKIASAKFSTLLKYPRRQMFFRKVFWTYRLTTLKSRALQQKELMKYLDFNREIFIPPKLNFFKSVGWYRIQWWYAERTSLFSFRCQELENRKSLKSIVFFPVET